MRASFHCVIFTASTYCTPIMYMLIAIYFLDTNHILSTLPFVIHVVVYITASLCGWPV